VRVVGIATVLGLACILAACGTASREADAAAVAERFQTALAGGDGAAACAELSENTSKALEQQEGEPCDEAILGLELPSGDRVGDTKVEVTSAAVSLLGGGTLFLDEAPDGWEIAAAGCSPTAPDLPFDCELEN
jgi:hypothetical protein